LKRAVAALRTCFEIRFFRVLAAQVPAILTAIVATGNDDSTPTTQLLENWRRGDEGAVDELVTRLYDELRSLAALQLARERAGHTLQPTAVVHEALLRLLGSELRPHDRHHFFALASRTMRRVLVDHARRYRADRRYSPSDRVTLDSSIEDPRTSAVDVLDLHRALGELAELAPRAAQVVELMVFGGLTRLEVAEVLDVGPSTVDRDWKAARLWLRRAIE
jgi:RNA polymerase sigma factor (TIGR02999 family)